MPQLDVVGRAGVDIVPILPNFHTQLKAAVLPIADRVGLDAGKAMGSKLIDALTAALQAKLPSVLTSAVNNAGKTAQKAALRQGEETGGAFARSLRAKLEAAFRAMPKLDIKLSDTGVDAQLARLRAKLEDLRNKRIGIDITTADADAKVQKLDEELARLGASHPNVAVRMDTATARAALAELRAEIKAATADPLTIPVRVGQFRESLIAQVEAAQAALPVLEIDADTDPARLALDRYRAELAAIPQRLRTDVDFDDAAAVAKIAEIEAQLDRLNRKHVAVDVRADAAAAAAQLAAIRAEVDALGSKHTDIKVDTSGAQGAVLNLAIQIAALAAIPAIPVLLAGTGALVSAFTAAGGAVGAFGLAAVPAIKNVASALQAQSAAQNNTTKATNAGANAGNQAAQRALQMAGAQQALASAHRSAASSIANANDSVTRAERSLGDAQKAEKQAQDDLTSARKTAADQLKALDSQLANGALDQQAATLRVRQAQEDLNTVLKDPKATQLQRDEARLTYAEALQHAKDQKDKFTELQKTAADQRKAGVAGADVVRQAEDKLATAHRNTADQAAAVAKAEKSAADARVQAAESIASAERGIASARLSSTSVTAKAVTKEDELRKALDKLTPSGRQLFDAIAGPRGLKTAFTDWSKALQPAVLPIFTRSVDGAKNTLPGLTPLVLSAARAIGTLQDKASNQLKNPFWTGFKADIKASAEPAIVGLGVAFGNTIKGMAGIIDAFLPHMAGIASHMDRITGRFANWGKNLKGSPAFEKFLAYVKSAGPGLAEFLGQLMSTLLDVSKAVAPLSQSMFKVFEPVLRGLSWLAIHAPEVIRILWGLYAVNKAISLGMTAFAVAMGLYNTMVALAGVETWSWAAAIQATGIVPLIELIVVAIVALGIGVYEAYLHVGWFRTAVDATWTAIKVSTLFLWNSVLKPSFQGIWWALKGIGDVSVWLWEHAIGPSFRFIWEAAKLLATILLVVVLGPLYVGFRVLAAVGTWLWGVLSPVFGFIGDSARAMWVFFIAPALAGIGAAAKWLWETVLKPFGGFVAMLFRGTGLLAKALYNEGIRPAFDWIADKARWLYDKGIKPWMSKLDDVAKGTSEAFRKMKDEIGLQWSALQALASKPVKFIIDHVYNNGIVPLWNGIAKITGAGKLDEMDLKGFSTGGIMSGYSPGRDDRVIAVGGGEAVMRPEWTKAVGPGYVNAANAAARTGGISGVQKALGLSGFSDGGVVGWFENKGKGALKAAKNGLSTVTGGLSDYLTDPGKIWDDALSTVRGLVADIGTSPWAKMIGEVPMSIVRGLKDNALDGVKGLFGGGSNNDVGGSGVQRWAPTVLQALQMVGQPADYLGITLRRMNQESGGNPNIVNTTDSNWLAGYPSVGLMQVIGPTFDSYAGPFRNTGPKLYGVSTNPLANIYASMKYAMSAYGDLPSAYNRAGGYDEGGYLPTGTSLVYNHTGKPEPVFTTGQWDTLRANATQGGGSPTVNANVRVYVGDREITDIVRTEIDVYDTDSARALTAGRRM